MSVEIIIGRGNGIIVIIPLEVYETIVTHFPILFAFHILFIVQEH